MRKVIIGTISLVAVGMLLVALFGVYKYTVTDGGDVVPGNDACTLEAMLCPDGSAVGRTGSRCEFAPCPSLSEGRNSSEFIAPLDRASERVTNKPFGILIKKATSPVQQERFSGYHTGTDFETFPDESDIDVSVYAVCTGVLEVKESASGYGGLVVQRCTSDGKPVSILYGHLALGSVTAFVGDILEQGSVIGTLGKAQSVDTDGERKHLHLGIFKGAGTASILGYVASHNELDRWIDPCLFVCK